jgi:hypothetical protein
VTVGAVPLPAGPLPDQAASVQVFSGQSPEAQIRIDQPHSVRSVQFSKAVPDTRLRITYRDKAVTAGSANQFTAAVVVRIDGLHVPLLDTVFDASAGSLGGFPIYAVSAPFTTVGWVTGIAAGAHVLDTAYVAGGSNPPIVGFISGSPFLVEVAELP